MRLKDRAALWLRPGLLAWLYVRVPRGVTGWRLLHAADGGMHVHGGQVVGAEESWPLEAVPIPHDLVEQHPELAWYTGLDAPCVMTPEVPRLLQGQVVVAAYQGDRVVAVTGVQHGIVLDDLYDSARTRTLGAHHADGRTDFALWAPTAREVELLTWPADAGAEPAIDDAQIHPLHRDPDGTWTTTLAGAGEWRYLYRVTVYVPTTGRVEQNLVTDPYSVALTLGSRRSVATDLADERWAPEQWRTAPQPRLEQWVDATIYELHVRDFSMSDPLVPERLRGSYAAFAHDGEGARHLRRLREAGLNTVHLLPVFDIATITEERGLRRQPPDLTPYAPQSERQQALVSKVKGDDGYNWGYDPFHWLAPEGSYATSDAAADGGHRIAELRTMIGAIHGMGLRVVLDQVFNHTHASGQWPHSVLDKVVPGYYHRLNEDGGVHQSTCCDNVATERVMAEKIMVDACVLWAREHKVDGFRFDLMGFHSRATMLAVRQALDALTPADAGVDGRQVQLYGEGWSFGEVAGNRLFVQASQGQLGGTGIATFSDRIRDAVRGGVPFDHDPRRQGFATGLGTCDNGHGLDASLGELTDLLQLGLAANLRTFQMRDHTGAWVRGDQVHYRDTVAAYAEEPDETLSYADAHDNETLWDALVLKLAGHLTMADRVRHNALALACVTLAQTPVLWHAGADLLRSKSLDRNSYDSGDWFNRLDWTGEDNGFGHGLPPAADNRSVWPILRPLLKRRDLKPSAEDVALATGMAQDLLRLRASTRLFRLGSAARVREHVRFPVAGTPYAIPGVVAYVVEDSATDPVDERWSGVVTILNGTPGEVVQHLPVDGPWVLSPVQQRGADDVVRASTWADQAFVVPARTAAVYVREL